ALPHELHARVGLGVVRGGAHRAAVEPVVADEEVEHLGGDHPGVDHGRALGGDAVPVAAGHLGGRQAHVAPEADAQLGGGLVGQVGEDAHERAADQLGDVAVHVVRVDAADV